jgi:hypothetical protein
MFEDSETRHLPSADRGGSSSPKPRGIRKLSVFRETGIKAIIKSFWMWEA